MVRKFSRAYRRKSTNQRGVGVSLPRCSARSTNLRIAIIVSPILRLSTAIGRPPLLWTSHGNIVEVRLQAWFSRSPVGNRSCDRRQIEAPLAVGYSCCGPNREVYGRAPWGLLPKSYPKSIVQVRRRAGTGESIAPAPRQSCQGERRFFLETSLIPCTPFVASLCYSQRARTSTTLRGSRVHVLEMRDQSLYS